MAGPAKSLDRKLAAIHADPSGCREFIIADAKDADMAFGIGAPGKSPEAHTGEVQFRTLADYRAQIREIVQQGLVDIMLMSASTCDVLAVQERLFDSSHVTPAARANDTSDIFVVRGGKYTEHASRPFRTASLDHIQCGHLDCAPEERTAGANLGLYSITFNNRIDEDLAALEQYNLFRSEAERKGFRHFLEVFDPNQPHGLSTADVPNFVNDSIARTLAGVAQAGRPLFLKVVYHGPRAMEDLVRYDPHLIVGILGGGAGTTYDAFKLISEAQKYGARVALFGRKINGAECQLAFVHFLRLIVEGEIGPEEAVRAYHAVLERLKIRPHRSLADDLVLQTGVMSYGGGSSAAVPAGVAAPVSELPTPIAAPRVGTSVAVALVAAEREREALPNRLGPITVAPVAKSGCGCGGGPKKPCACQSGDSTSPSAATPLPDAAAATAAPARSNASPTDADAEPDFARMTTSQKRAWQQAKRDRIFGRWSR